MYLYQTSSRVHVSIGNPQPTRVFVTLRMKRVGDRPSIEWNINDVPTASTGNRRGLLACHDDLRTASSHNGWDKPLRRGGRQGLLRIDGNAFLINRGSTALPSWTWCCADGSSPASALLGEIDHRWAILLRMGRVLSSHTEKEIMAASRLACWKGFLQCRVNLWWFMMAANRTKENTDGDRSEPVDKYIYRHEVGCFVWWGWDFEVVGEYWAILTYKTDLICAGDLCWTTDVFSSLNLCVPCRRDVLPGMMSDSRQFNRGLRT